MIDRTNSPTALPLYLQVSELLIREIAAGRLSNGERLPPERKLAAQYGITVRTLRKSLAELSNRGLLESVQGGRATTYALTITLKVSILCSDLS